jgi:hypothetical protein
VEELVTLRGDSPATWLRLRSSDGDAREIGGRRPVGALGGAAGARAALDVEALPSAGTAAAGPADTRPEVEIMVAIGDAAERRIGGCWRR